MLVITHRNIFVSKSLIECIFSVKTGRTKHINKGKSFMVHFLMMKDKYFILPYNFEIELAINVSFFGDKVPKPKQRSHFSSQDFSQQQKD